MQQQKTQRLTPRQLGMLFLVPGVIFLVIDRFSSPLMGFYSFATVFGALMVFLPEKRS